MFRLQALPVLEPSRNSGEPFPRPHRVDERGERLQLPSKTEMIRRILHAHPSPEVSNSRSLYDYHPGRHSIGSLRELQRPEDVFCPRWQ
jgi:hypothetical protein